jgi:hypothetical protein
MIKNIFFCLLGLVNLYACGEKSAKKSSTEVVQTVALRPAFSVKTTIDTAIEDTPRTVVSVVWNQQTIVLDTMIGAFNPVDTSDFKRHRIPKTAIATGTGFWAGLETTYILDSTATGWSIQRKYEDEEQEEGDTGVEQYEILKVLPFKK